MPLVKKLQKSSREQDTAILDKVNNKQVANMTVKGGKSILDTINSITAVVNTKLGKYKDKYVVLRTEDEIMLYISKIQANHISALDTETSGLDPISDELAGICLYTPGEKAAYIPYGHISYITQQRVNNQPSKEFLLDVFNSLSDIKWIFHNAKFDIRVMRNQLGIDLIPYWDTMLASKCIDENESAALKNLHLKYCNSSDTESLTYDKLFEGIPFTLVPIKTGYLYAAGDAIKTFELYEYQKTVLNRRNLPGPYNVFMNIEMPTIRVVADMEDRGITLNVEYAKQLSEKYHKQLEENEKAVYDIINNYSVQINKYIKTHPDNKLSNPINISSPTQIAILLYDILGLQSPDKNKPRGTGEEILTALDHPLSKVILDYRGTVKLLSTYIDKMPEIVNPKTGRIHCSFNQYGAKTGRFSSDNPNMQNIPSHNKDIRKMFSGNNGAFSFFTKKVKKSVPAEEQKEEKKKEAKKLKRYPTLLKIKGFESSSEDFVKVIRKGGKGKIILETDVENTFLSRSDDAGSIEITTLDFGKNGGSGGGKNIPSEDSTKLRVQFSGPCEGEIEVMIEPREEVEVGDNIRLSIKMISSAGEYEVVAFIKIDNEAQQPKEPKEKTVEEPELSLPKLTRVVQYSEDPEQAKWSDYGMTSESIVKIQINPNGAIDEVLINMDSNLVKKLINAKGANVERVRNKYISSIYSHILMVYTTMYGYYSKDDIEIDEYVRKDIQESLNAAVEFSFQYYANFLLTYENFSD